MRYLTAMIISYRSVGLLALTAVMQLGDNGAYGLLTNPVSATPTPTTDTSSSSDATINFITIVVH